MSLSEDERKTLRRNCPTKLHAFDEPAPAVAFREMAQWCEANDVEHDSYGDGKLITEFEAKIARVLGKPAAAFIPSGTMAQLIALRIWTERSRLGRFGMHATAHLENYEEQAYQALFGLHAVRVGQADLPILAEDLEKVAEPLACLIVELPMRELGGALPKWDELEALAAAARHRGIALHMDGARFWEARAFYQRSYAQIAFGFDSVYVSMYKGIGGLAGALLAGTEDFVANARVWRRRMGGTLVHQSPMIASAAMRFDARIAQLDACYARTLSLAAALNALPGIKTLPTEPQSNMLHILFQVPPKALLDARDRMAIEDKCWLFGHARQADVPGWSRIELYVGDTLVGLPNEQVIPLFARLMSTLPQDEA